MKKISNLQLFLTVLFVSSLLIANVVTAKQIKLPFGITMTGAIIIFPVTYVLSDLFSEVYGYIWSRKTCYYAFTMNLLMVLVFEIVIATPAPSYWENQEAFATVLGSTPKVLLASMLAFIAGDFANDKVFAWLKAKHKDEKGFCVRAILSSFVGELMDSIIFVPFAFVGTMPVKTMFVMGITQVCLKVGFEIAFLPLTKMAVSKALLYEKAVQYGKN